MNESTSFGPIDARYAIAGNHVDGGGTVNFNFGGVGSLSQGGLERSGLYGSKFMVSDALQVLPTKPLLRSPFKRRGRSPSERRKKVRAATSTCPNSTQSLLTSTQGACVLLVSATSTHACTTSHAPTETHVAGCSTRTSSSFGNIG
jgi:hypothetical protein